MTTTYTWKINRLITEHIDGQQNVVTTVSYEIKGDDGTNQGTSGGKLSVKYNANETFTPFEELTEQQIIDWVTTKLGDWGINREKSIVDEHLNNLKSTPEPINLDQHNTPWRT